MLHYKIYENNSLFGVMYNFPLVGDGLPMHDHAQGRKHNVIVLRRAVEVYGPDKNWSITLTQGDIFDFTNPTHYPHEITATVDNTEIMAFAINGKHPEDTALHHGHTSTLLKDGRQFDIHSIFSQPRDIRRYAHL